MLAARRHRANQLEAARPVTINAVWEMVNLRLLEKHGIHRDQIEPKELSDLVKFCFFCLASEARVDYVIELFADRYHLAREINRRAAERIEHGRPRVRH
jgi:hypothetical protein